MCLKVASVIGIEFSLEMLKLVFPIKEVVSHLSVLLISLCKNDFLISTDSKDLNFIFSNEIINQVSYSRLLLEQKKEFHQYILYELETNPLFQKDDLLKKAKITFHTLCILICLIKGSNFKQNYKDPSYLIENILPMIEESENTLYTLLKENNYSKYGLMWYLNRSRAIQVLEILESVDEYPKINAHKKKLRIIHLKSNKFFQPQKNIPALSTGKWVHPQKLSYPSSPRHFKKTTNQTAGITRQLTTQSPNVVQNSKEVLNQATVIEKNSISPSVSIKTSSNNQSTPTNSPTLRKKTIQLSNSPTSKKEIISNIKIDPIARDLNLTPSPRGQNTTVTPSPNNSPKTNPFGQNNKNISPTFQLISSEKLLAKNSNQSSSKDYQLGKSSSYDSVLKKTPSESPKGFSSIQFPQYVDKSYWVTQIPPNHTHYQQLKEISIAMTNIYQECVSVSQTIEKLALKIPYFLLAIEKIKKKDSIPQIQKLENIISSVQQNLESESQKCVVIFEKLKSESIKAITLDKELKFDVANTLSNIRHAKGVKEVLNFVNSSIQLLKKDFSSLVEIINK